MASVRIPHQDANRRHRCLSGAAYLRVNVGAAQPMNSSNPMDTLNAGSLSGSAVEASAYSFCKNQGGSFRCWAAPICDLVSRC